MNHYLNELEKARREMDENGMGEDIVSDGAKFYGVVIFVIALFLMVGFLMGSMSCAA